ncbi:amidohydrolase family protein [Neptunicella sp. SCSIO 80796]|uniref:amidohydrolase family protein n=1 Tax=Neptunicella plasticusilytica TaxID=3117012 RepID=UPI003A4DF5B7
MKALMHTLATASLLCSLSVQADKIAIVGGTLHTMAEQGSLTDKALLIDGERVADIVEMDAVPDGYQIINAKDKVITPGLIGAVTQLGLEEVGYSAGTVDASVDKSDFSPLGAAFDVSYALNPDSSLIDISRIEGITSAASGINRSAGLFKGQGAMISLGDAPSMLIKSKAFMTVDVNNDGADNNSGSRAALWPMLENALNEAASRKGKLLEPSDEWFGSLAKADINALQNVLDGSEPLMMAAHRVADIRQVISFKARHPDIKVVLLYATEGWMIAQDIAEAGIPVILNPESNLPYAFDQLAATLANAGRLADAGVLISIGMESHNIRLVTQQAGNAVANGLSWEDGLASLTINTARIYAIDKDYGSLQAGKIADVVVWSDDPLEVMNAAEMVIIHGEPIKLESRQTKLRDRYMQASKQKPVHYQRP